MNVTVETGDPSTLKLLEENARYMRHEQFSTLVANIKRDGDLTQIPFVWFEEDTGTRHVLSGNHRVMAAMEAGLKEIRWLETADKLNKSQRLAIQLSHNAIAGEDDASILAKLYQEIDDLEMKHYSGLDDRSLELLREAQVDSLQEPKLEFQTLSYVFLPGDGDRVMEAFDAAAKYATKATETWLARYEDHFRLLQAVEESSSSYDVRNRSAALTYILDIYENHRDELQAGYIDETTDKPKHKRSVPITTVLTTDYIGTEDAIALKKALNRMKELGQAENKGAPELLAQLARDYLEANK